MNENWLDIARWLQENAPETAASLRSPADLAAFAAAEEGFPDVPVQLQETYALFDGTERTPAGYLYPMFRPLSAREAISEWRMLTGIWREAAREEEREIRQRLRDPQYLNLMKAGGGSVPEPDNPYDPLRLGKQAAGTPSHVFLPAFIPIAENMSGDYLFVDTRQGTAHGSIRQYWKEEADCGPTLWDSPAGLFQDLGRSLRTGEPLGYGAPAVRAGGLVWEL